MQVVRRARLSRTREAWYRWVGTARADYGRKERERLKGEHAKLEETHTQLVQAHAQLTDERARLKGEVASLTDALAVKREACERLRHANARVVAQFEAAEREFLEHERRRADAAPTTVVGRLVEAIFGPETQAQNETLDTIIELDQRGEPQDRMTILAYGSDSYERQPLGAARPRRGTRVGSPSPSKGRRASTHTTTKGRQARSGVDSAATSAKTGKPRAAATSPRDVMSAAEAREIAAAIYGRALLRAERELV